LVSEIDEDRGCCFKVLCEKIEETRFLTEFIPSTRNAVFSDEFFISESHILTISKKMPIRKTILTIANEAVVTISFFGDEALTSPQVVPSRLMTNDDAWPKH